MPSQPRYRSRRTLAPQASPAGIYASTYDVELGAAICRRLAGGESLRAICRADVAMPTEKTVWNWARAHEEFRLMKAHALATARAASLAAQAERDAARWARGRPGQASGYCPQVVDVILDRLVVGEGLEDICRDPAMPCVGTVYGWMRRYPEFLAAYRGVKTMVEEAVVELACADLPWLGERKSWPMLRRTVRAAQRAARRLSLKRLAPAAGPRRLKVRLEDAEGRQRTIYDG